jgi:DNA mismatch endonuclease, patch repair protein
MADRPPPSSPEVSAFMRGMKRADTRPEIQLRRALHALGLRFRLHDARLPGRPDVVLPRSRIVVFVDGCFWHGCPDHGVAPKANAEFWRTKLEANRARDLRVDDALRALGWTAVRVWEHEAAGEAASRVALMCGRPAHRDD